jgi:hypothetical protein
MTDEELSEIEARANAATAEPWVYGSYDGRYIVRREDLTPVAEHRCCHVIDGQGTDCSGCGPLKRHDAVFVASARTDVPTLVQEVRRLRAENEMEQDRKASYRDDAHELRAEVVELREILDATLRERDSDIAESVTMATESLQAEVASLKKGVKSGGEIWSMQLSTISTLRAEVERLRSEQHEDERQQLTWEERRRATKAEAALARAVKAIRTHTIACPPPCSCGLCTVLAEHDKEVK